MNQLIMQAAQQYSREDRQRFVEYVRNEPMAAAQLRAPLVRGQGRRLPVRQRRDQRPQGEPRGARGRIESRGRPCPRPGLRPRSRTTKPAKAEEGGRKAKKAKAAAKKARGCRPRRPQGREAGEEGRRQAGEGRGGGEGRAEGRRPQEGSGEEACRRRRRPIGAKVEAAASLRLRKRAGLRRGSGRTGGGDAWTQTVAATHRRPAPLLQ